MINLEPLELGVVKLVHPHDIGVRRVVAFHVLTSRHVTDSPGFVDWVNDFGWLLASSLLGRPGVRFDVAA